jgi:hypothetical protein
VKQSLKNVLKASKNIVAMSRELEQMADSLYDKQVPVL